MTRPGRRPAGRRRWWPLVLLFCALVGCTVKDDVPVATVSSVVRQLPGPSTLVRATVTDSRNAPGLLIELSDPAREEHIWVSGFAVAPGRGEEVWTSMLGPPVAHDLVGAVYPSAGPLSPPVRSEHVTARSALAAAVGAVAAVVLVVFTIVLASGWSRRTAARRCSGCSGAVASDWSTCPRCGRSLVVPPLDQPAAGPVTVQPAAPLPLPSGDAVPAGTLDRPSAPTRIIRPDGP